MKVFATKVIPDNAKAFLSANNIVVDEWTNQTPITKNELTKIVTSGKYTGLFVLGAKIDAEIIHAIQRNIQVISLLSVGYDNIDLHAATMAGIPVSNTPDVLNDATAETAFLLMQNVARKAFYNYRRIMEDKWHNDSFITNLGVDLQGKTLGIFGLGKIGLVMGKLCRAAFNMEVIYHNRSRNPKADKTLNAQFVSFDELLHRSDVLSIHCALTPETTRVFNAAVFKKMKNSSILINTARGKVVDEPALIQALQKAEIWGAGLDVTDPEPMQPDNPLLQMATVAVLPHIGSATVNTRHRMAQLAAENMLLGLTGKRLKTIVNEEVYSIKK
ncbi:2-hydroxyacid dehydrogenase [Arachidicoccus terrestris]|uniref:2-hydroxyacid dehydrogenase n=1 Tax=Arachidicoccus terrestris TaxID=2875539 RepID=UPI001CC7F8B1|nr:D-glycerate dehydrogenase [Arachidicoccus terrestris]UAY56827.1 D-glycerate dehydrogenase [Arachidicoccus terrestris]